MDEEPILVRAMVNLAGFPRGESRYVDPSDPEMAELLASGLIVPLSDERGEES